MECADDDTINSKIDEYFVKQWSVQEIVDFDKFHNEKPTISIENLA